MSRYVITITPDTADETEAANAQTTVRVDTSTGQTRITELTVRAADTGGLAPADLPAIDLDLLIRALAAPSTIRALPAHDVATGESPVVHYAQTGEEEAEEEARPTGPARARRAAKRAATRKAVGRKATKTAAKAGKAAKKAAAKATGRARKASAGEDRPRRAYRRMPEPGEVLAAYQETGSITGLAQHYGVPRHTANGWARRLRQQGHSIGRS